MVGSSMGTSTNVITIIIGRNQSVPFFLQNQLHSVLESDVPEEVAHALLVVDPPDALRQQDRDVHGLF